MTRAAFVFALIFSPFALASETADAPGPASGWVQFRVGATTTAIDGARPNLCVELAAGGRLSVEGCGNGSGFLFADPQPELAHFRAKWRLGSWTLAGGMLEARAGAGFAELQVAADAPGFSFGRASDDGAATAGPEGSAFLRWSLPLGRGFEGLVEAAVAAAWLAGAPALVRPAGAFQPSALVTVGAGF